MSEVNLPLKTERDAKIDSLKNRANALFLKLKLNQTEFSIMSREYIQILKELELEVIKPNF